MRQILYRKDVIKDEYVPTLYPGESSENWEVPDLVSNDFYRLNSIIEGKYSIEFLKICAFYNKMFPSLKSSEWCTSSYNVPSFTSQEQERSDTGTGTNFNYLKQIVDQITSRLGTISFIPMLISEDQSFEYLVYKDEAERVLRTFIRDDNYVRICLEAFHNAAILGYSHVFIDPYTGKLTKANDYEIGIFESQFNKRSIVQMLYRDYSFPAAEALNYLSDCDDAQKAEILDAIDGKSTVDFKMFFDCAIHKVFVTIENKTLPPHEYPFEHVLMTTFQWDVGFARHLTTSEFDLLYPIQREINKIAAKIQQLVRLYKGSIPVFSNDCDLAMKAISNGTGEALYVDSSRPVDTLMTVINPTPLDAQLQSQIESFKTAMYELAGIQSASFDMENMRSAAAVIALDQTRDSIFQSQMSGMAQFIKEGLGLYVEFFAAYPEFSKDRGSVDWKSISDLMHRSYIQLQPVHLNDPLSDENNAKQEAPDYVELAVNRTVLSIAKGEMTFATLPYYVDYEQIILHVAALLIKFEALGIQIPDHVHVFLVDAFLDFIAKGNGEL